MIDKNEVIPNSNSNEEQSANGFLSIICFFRWSGALVFPASTSTEFCHNYHSSSISAILSSQVLFMILLR